MRRTTTAVILLILLTGCVSSEVMTLGGTSYPPRPDDYLIEFYTTTDAPVNILQEMGTTKPLSAIPNGASNIGAHRNARLIGRIVEKGG